MDIMIASNSKPTLSTIYSAIFKSSTSRSASTARRSAIELCSAISGNCSRKVRNIGQSSYLKLPSNYVQQFQVTALPNIPYFSCPFLPLDNNESSGEGLSPDNVGSAR